MEANRRREQGGVWGLATLVDIILALAGILSGSIFLASLALAAFLSASLLLVHGDHTTRRRDTKRAIALYLAALLLSLGTGVWISNETAKKLLAMQKVIDDLPITAGLYKAVPGTSDLIVRGFRIDQKKESLVILHGPAETDDLVLGVSAWRWEDSKWIASFTARGRIGENEITGGLKSFEVKAGARSKPIYATSHAFYVFVDEITPDGAFISIARRDLGIGAILRDIIAPLDAVVFETPEPPAILSCPKP
jgi:hypothetical protein